MRAHRGYRARRPRQRIGAARAGTRRRCARIAGRPAGRRLPRASVRLSGAPVRGGPHADARAERDGPDERGGHHRPLPYHLPRRAPAPVPVLDHPANVRPIARSAVIQVFRNSPVRVNFRHPSDTA
ncbi:hypothetical protein SHJG_5982 [Streptomyces hygroscopicus subsp. jinggangensis 5008]|nr:hypothetical protein SHJG_5982 [Streptomyces hygroscopicus subsp. jinggangensis 5008]AGF65407.1 hypothetical protein SHJGH_5744 [Streptomyces hygroscopicus subsp. jinggangensis TL01]